MGLRFGSSADGQRKAGGRRAALQPSKRRSFLCAAKAEAWRHFKKKADSYVYWIQYRRRRDQA